MQKSGTVTFSNGEPSLDGGTRLARCGDPSPFVAAGTFLRNRGIRSGQTINVEGDEGTINGDDIFCMTAASRTASLAAALRKKPRAKKAAKKAPAKKVAKKAAVKKAPEKAATKKSPRKKAAAKKGAHRPRRGK